MNDPRKEALPQPKDMIQRIEIFARDLAYGYRFGEFPDRYTVQIIDFDSPAAWYLLNADDAVIQEFDEYLSQKWSNNPPSIEVLEEFGFLKQLEDGAFLLTVKAFDLLNDPRQR